MARPKPDFLLIGAQKSGTTWLWQRVLEPHPGTSLGQKEIHFFGGVENYRRGREWYFDHFSDLDASKVVGEASTSYLYDRIPYWHSEGREIEYEASLPSIPQLIAEELPDAKILVVLRNPVSRAISAYKHALKKETRQWARGFSPRLGLRRTALEHPKVRILEYGYYARHLEAWMDVFPRDRIRVYIFEEDVVRHPERTAEDVYRFLGLDPAFDPSGLREREHTSMGFTRLWLRYYSDPITWKLISSRYANFLDDIDPLARFSVTDRDRSFLESIYAPEVAKLEVLLDRDLSLWTSGWRSDASTRVTNTDARAIG